MQPLDASGVPVDVAGEVESQSPPPPSAAFGMMGLIQQGVDLELAGIVPNDRTQQRIALVGAATAAEVFDADMEFQEQLRAVAARHAAVEGVGAAENARTAASAHARNKRKQTAQAGMEEAALLGHAPENRGTGMHGSELMGELHELAEGVLAGEEAAERSYELTTEQRFQELRQKFIKWGGRVLFERSTGGTALRKLAKAEKKLVAQQKKSKGTDPMALRAAVAELRKDHGERFRPKLDEIKQRFVQASAERYKFWHVPQPGVGPQAGMARPPDDFEAGHTIDSLGGLITGGKDEGNLEVADSVVEFARAIKTRSPVGIDITTYKGHSWGRYSLDLFPKVPVDERGYYERERVVEVFMVLDQAAEDSDVDWRALYNDFEVAKQVNAALGEKLVSFQWEHGPSPYVLHIHLDVMPRAYAEKRP